MMDPDSPPLSNSFHSLSREGRQQAQETVEEERRREEEEQQERSTYHSQQQDGVHRLRPRQCHLQGREDEEALSISSRVVRRRDGRILENQQVVGTDGFPYDHNHPCTPPSSTGDRRRRVASASTSLLSSGEGRVHYCHAGSSGSRVPNGSVGGETASFEGDGGSAVLVSSSAQSRSSGVITERDRCAYRSSMVEQEERKIQERKRRLRRRETCDEEDEYEGGHSDRSIYHPLRLDHSSDSSSSFSSSLSRSSSDRRERLSIWTCAVRRQATKGTTRRSHSSDLSSTFS